MTGVIEALGGVAAFVILGLRFMLRYVELLDRANGEGTANASGVLVWISFLFSPAGIASACLALEGITRILSGAVLQEPLASGPVWIVFRVYDWTTRPRAPRTPPPRDLVTKLADGALRVERALAPGWDELATIEVDGSLYRVRFAEERPGHARPHAITLEPVPHGWIVRKHVRYER